MNRSIASLVGAALFALLSACSGSHSPGSPCAGIPPGEIGFGCLGMVNGGIGCRCEVWSEDCQGNKLEYLHDCTGAWQPSICDTAGPCPPH